MFSEPRFGKQKRIKRPEKVSHSPGGVRVEEAAESLCCPEASWMPPTSTADTEVGSWLCRYFRHRVALKRLVCGRLLVQWRQGLECSAPRYLPTLCLVGVV